MYITRRQWMAGAATIGLGLALDARAGEVCLPDDGTNTLAQLGTPGAPVVIEAFQEFQCPFCIRAVGTLNEIITANPETVRYIYHHFPLPFHKRAEAAAIASVAAQLQGKFWPFHDLAVANHRTLEDQDLASFAEQAGLNMNRYYRDIADPAVAQVVANDHALGEGLGVTGVPCFFVNGRRLTGARPAADFQTMIDEELVKAVELSRQGYGPRDHARILTRRNREAEEAAEAAAEAAKAESPPLR